jgi:radical SAM protein with 4Fe4S-binding SPASM domain
MMRLAIEVTNICNANCSFCAYRYMKRRKYILSDGQFKYFLERYKEYGGGELKLTPIVGDPLVDRNLINKIKMAKRAKEIRHLYMYTNLIGLGNFNIKDFLLSGIDEIDVSTCICSREMYKRIFGVDRYDTVMHNLQLLLEQNKKLGHKVKINISLRCEKPYRVVRSSPDYKYIINLYGRHLEILDDKYDNWTGLIKLDDLPRGQRFRKLKNMSEPCSLFYKGLIIFANGDVGACWCRDVEARLIVGNIYKDLLEDIWKGERLRLIRENWMEGYIPSVCRNCYQYTPLSEFLLANKRRILGMKTYKNGSY